MIKPEQVRDYLDYDEATGQFKWRFARKNGQIPAGTVAGSITRYGYIRIEINKRSYFAHRLAWLYVTGEWPDKFVDHIDGCKTNNRFANLRLASQLENQWNRKQNRTNTSGYKGVTWDKRKQKWQASIRVNRKSLFLGLYDQKEQAFLAAQEARAKYHGSYANDGTLPQEVSDE